MLPASMHILLAEDCVFQRKNMVTASMFQRNSCLNDKATEKECYLMK